MNEKHSYYLVIIFTILVFLSTGTFLIKMYYDNKLETEKLLNIIENYKGP